MGIASAKNRSTTWKKNYYKILSADEHKRTTKWHYESDSKAVSQYSVSYYHLIN